MRILIDYRPALRERTGVGEYVYQLVQALADEAAAAEPLAVTIFSSSWKDRLAPFDSGRVHTVDRRIPVRLLNALWHRLSWPPIEMLTGRTYDVVHSPHPLLIPTRRAAQVITIHDLDFLDHPEHAGAEIQRDYPSLVKLHAQWADRVVVVSRHTAGQVERRLGVPAEKNLPLPQRRTQLDTSIGVARRGLRAVPGNAGAAQECRYAASCLLGARGFSPRHARADLGRPRDAVRGAMAHNPSRATARRKGATPRVRPGTEAAGALPRGPACSYCHRSKKALAFPRWKR